MAFNTFIPNEHSINESVVIDPRPDGEHPDDRKQRLRHEDERHTQAMKHRQEIHDQNKRHRDEAHKHNLKKADDNDFAYAPAVYAYSEPSVHAHFTTAGESPNAGAGTSGTTADTPSGGGSGGAGAASGGAA